MKGWLRRTARAHPRGNRIDANRERFEVGRRWLMMCRVGRAMGSCGHTPQATEDASDATAAEGVTYASRKKAQSALRALYDDLGQLGFQQQHVEAVLQHQATQAMPSQEAALHWLCLNVPPDQLPAKFVSRSRAIAAAGACVCPTRLGPETHSPGESSLPQPSRRRPCTPRHDATAGQCL